MRIAHTWRRSSYIIMSVVSEDRDRETRRIAFSWLPDDRDRMQTRHTPTTSHMWLKPIEMTIVSVEDSRLIMHVAERFSWSLGKLLGALFHCSFYAACVRFLRMFILLIERSEQFADSGAIITLVCSVVPARSVCVVRWSRRLVILLKRWIFRMGLLYLNMV